MKDVGGLKQILRYLLKLNRSVLISLTFASIIAAGTLLLMLPVANTGGKWLAPLDALFMSTSAACVSGMAVLDIGRDFTVFGQIVVLLLFQVGALGVMTLTSLITVGAKKRISMRQRLLMQEAMNQNAPGNVVNMALKIIKITLLVEFISGALLSCYFYPDAGLKGIYYGYYHAISAFCNAGFDVLGHGNSLAVTKTNIFVNVIIMALIVAGSIGFPVLRDIWRNTKWNKFSLHTKLTLTVNAVLIAGGCILIWLLEKGNTATLGLLGTGDQFLVALFQSVTLRTAGFTTMDIASARNATLFLMMIFMFIGASSASMGGGIKTSTFAVLVASTMSLLRGRKDVVLFKRRIGQDLVAKSTSIFVLAVLYTCAAFFLLLALDDRNQPFMHVAFEIFATVGTTGIGIGITEEWNNWCRLVMIVSMFVGRIGILTFSLSFIDKKSDALRYPSENILIG